MTQNRGYVSATELMNRLKADPGWAEANEKREAQHQAREKMLAREEQPLVEALGKIGCKVESVYDLVNQARPYSDKMVRLLADHLTKKYHSRIREGIARALTTPQAKIVLPDLLTAFRSDPDASLNGAKWAIGNAISELATSEHFQEIVDLVLDVGHGEARTELVRWLGGRPDAAAVLSRLQQDPDVSVRATAQAALRVKSGESLDS